jgi:RNA recognition motif-containing protein
LRNKLYVGNLPFSVTEEELRELCEKHGRVESVHVVMDRETGRPRGFAFVEFQEASGAEAAQRALDGSQVGDRTIRVNEAHERRGGGGFRGGRGGPRS